MVAKFEKSGWPSRRKQIDLLLEAEFPSYHAEDWAIIRQKRGNIENDEQFINELIESVDIVLDDSGYIDGLSPLIWVISVIKTEENLHNISEEHLQKKCVDNIHRSNNLKPDFNYWKHQAMWTIEEFAMLAIDIDPRFAADIKKEFFCPSIIRSEYVNTTNMINSSRKYKIISTKDLPENYVRWALNKNLKIPDKMHELRGANDFDLTKGDRDFLHRIAQLESENERLKSLMLDTSSDLNDLKKKVIKKSIYDIFLVMLICGYKYKKGSNVVTKLVNDSHHLSNTLKFQSSDYQPTFTENTVRNCIEHIADVTGADLKSR